jgi:tRNA uridine 5-carbamoylmethylation protein Kti12
VKTLIILRGLPGAGKTTIIKKLEKQYSETATVCSADHFFYFGKEHIPENYHFQRDMLNKAHGSCRTNCSKAIQENKPLIIIDNTNIKLRDFKDYIELAYDGGYKIICHSITGMTAEDSFNSNVHNVPIETCAKMLSSYSPCPRKIIIKNSSVDVEEVVHDFHQIRKGVFANGKFIKKNS